MSTILGLRHLRHVNDGYEERWSFFFFFGCHKYLGFFFKKFLLVFTIYCYER